MCAQYTSTGKDLIITKIYAGDDKQHTHSSVTKISNKNNSSNKNTNISFIQFPPQTKIYLSIVYPSNVSIFIFVFNFLQQYPVSIFKAKLKELFGYLFCARGNSLVSEWVYAFIYFMFMFIDVCLHTILRRYLCLRFNIKENKVFILKIV